MSKEQIPGKNDRTAKRVAVVGAPSVNVPYHVYGVDVKGGMASYQHLGQYPAREIENGHVIGGSAINTAVSLNRIVGSRVGVTLVTFLGKDRFTTPILDLLAKEGIDDVHQNSTDRVPNDKVNEFLLPGGIRYLHVKSYNRARDTHYEELSPTPDYLFLTAVNWPWTQAYQNTVSYSADKNIPFAFSPGPSELYAMELTQEGLGRLQVDLVEYRGFELGGIKKTFFDTLSAATMLFVNRTDAERILTEAAKFYGEESLIDSASGVPGLLTRLQRLGPQIVSITDGENGNYAADAQGHMHKTDPFRIATDTRGDTISGTEAYAGTFLSYHLLGMTVSESMKYAGINARSVNNATQPLTGMLDAYAIETTADLYPAYHSHTIWVPGMP